MIEARAYFHEGVTTSCHTRKKDGFDVWYSTSYFYSGVRGVAVNACPQSSPDKSFNEFIMVVGHQSIESIECVRLWWCKDILSRTIKACLLFMILDLLFLQWCQRWGLPQEHHGVITLMKNVWGWWTQYRTNCVRLKGVRLHSQNN